MKKSFALNSDFFYYYYFLTQKDEDCWVQLLDAFVPLCKLLLHNAKQMLIRESEAQTKWVKRKDEKSLI